VGWEFIAIVVTTDGMDAQENRKQRLLLSVLKVTCATLKIVVKCTKSEIQAIGGRNKKGKFL
jgi:hypothetical protein